MTEWRITQAEVLDAARAGRLDAQWVPLVAGIDCMADAARLDGVRVPVTSATAEAIAREWGAELPTPATCDLRHAAALERGIVVEPATQDYRVMMTAEAVLAYNQALDARGAPPSGSEGPALIVSDVGKVWCMTAELARRRASGESTLACNYGFFTAAARTPRGKVGPKPSATGRFNLWQEPGYRHNAAHWDYSQTLQLVRVARGYQQPSTDRLTERVPLVDSETDLPIIELPPERVTPAAWTTDASTRSWDVAAAVGMLGLAIGLAAWDQRLFS